MSATVLIVEDEVELAGIVVDYARAAGHAPVALHDGGEALARLDALRPDLVVLDLMLPGVDGLALCREIRRASDVPIIMTTARVEEIDRVIGLDAGADDYVCKPYSPRELMARIAAQLRRYRGHHERARDVCVDEASRSARVRGRPVELTATEFALFAAMARRRGAIFTRAQLLDIVDRDNLDVTERAVDSHVKNLRRKLATQAGAGDLIQSVYGAGYRLDC